jgi:hypothetical protein
MKSFKAFSEMESPVSEDAGGGVMAGSPGNNTRSGPGMGDDNTLRTRSARIYKGIYRRHKTPQEYLSKG